MNSNLDTCISLREIGLEYTCLHDEEAIKDLHGVPSSQPFVCCLSLPRAMSLFHLVGQLRLARFSLMRA
jgi:hypothetical protein